MASRTAGRGGQISTAPDRAFGLGPGRAQGAATSQARPGEQRHKGQRRPPARRGVHRRSPRPTAAKALKREWIGWIGPERLYEAYGGTERIGGTLISGAEWLAHPGSVGKPTGDRKIRILGDDGEDQPAGEVGEVYMMPPGGPGSTYRYVGAEARSTSDGWETLGDLGYLDTEGYLYLVDRRTDMIVTGGSNVYPAEVEAALEAHPSVLSCAVIGLPDDDFGQRVHAIVEFRAPVDDDTLRSHLAEHLVRYKIPKSFEAVDHPLRDEAGKLRRTALREARIEG